MFSCGGLSGHFLPVAKPLAREPGSPLPFKPCLLTHILTRKSHA